MTFILAEELDTHLYTIMRKLLKSAGDFWSSYQTDEFFHIKFVIVHGDYGRQGILKEMVQRSLSMARTLGLTAAKLEASGIYSQSAFEKLGFEKLASIKYEDYKRNDDDQHNVFGFTGIHRTLNFYTKRIQPLELA